jgi:hypothetical protein
MFWRTDLDDDPGMENYGGSGYLPNFFGHTIVYGGNKDKIFVFDPKSILVAITDDIEEAEQEVLLALRTNSKVQDRRSKLATTTLDVSTQTDTTKTNAEVEELRLQLQALKAKQEQQQRTISNDKQKPLINIVGTAMNGPQGTIEGYVRDNTGIAEVRVDGKLVDLDSYGNFMAYTYVPQSGINVSIEAVDLAGLTSSMSVRLDRVTSSTSAVITFDRLNPLGRSVASNKDALALIIGVDGYENTPARAIYADSDAQMFADYATEKLGIPANRIKTLVNDNADFADVLLSVREWLGR